MPDRSLSADEFTRAFAQHGRTLWVIASAWVGRNEADDLVQETARVAWQRRQQFTMDGDIRAWLSQIVRHLGANARRKRRPQALDPIDLPEVAQRVDVSPTWPFDAEANGLSQELARGLAALPEVARECLLLHAVLGCSFAEIAAMLDIPENTATSHARRARLALRATLSPEQFHLSPAPAMEQP